MCVSDPWATARTRKRRGCVLGKRAPASPRPLQSRWIPDAAAPPPPRARPPRPGPPPGCTCPDTELGIQRRSCKRLGPRPPPPAHAAEEVHSIRPERETRDKEASLPNLQTVGAGAVESVCTTSFPFVPGHTVDIFATEEQPNNNL